MLQNSIARPSTSVVITILFILCLVAATAIAQTNSENENVRFKILDDFQKNNVGEFPIGWYDRDGNKKLREHNPDVVKDYHYKIKQENGNKFLRYEGTAAKHINLPFINRNEENIHNINIYETPILSWKVRAHILPANANEDNNDLNDSVASVYVVFDFGRIALFKKVPKTIRYTWSTTLEENTQTSKLFGNQKIVVVESGNDKTGEWVTFERNIVEDYRRLFGDDPPKTPLAILILSDGDSTNSFVKADYDDFILKNFSDSTAE